MSVPIWLRCGVVARRLGVDRKTIRNWIHAGRLAAVRLPGNETRPGEFRISGADAAVLGVPARSGGKPPAGLTLPLFGDAVQRHSCDLPVSGGRYLVIEAIAETREGPHNIRLVRGPNPSNVEMADELRRLADLNRQGVLHGALVSLQSLPDGAQAARDIPTPQEVSHGS